jgi:hypothetical protein
MVNRQWLFTVISNAGTGEQSTRASHNRYEKHPDCHAVSHDDPCKPLSQDFQFSRHNARAYSGRLKCVKDYEMLGTSRNCTNRTILQVKNYR